MASSLFFGGRLYTSPATVSSVDDSGMVPVLTATGNGLALVGLSDGGEPNVAIAINGPADAAAKLVSGELLTAVNKCYSAFSAVGAPGSITVVRVGQATASTVTLKDTAGAASIILNSVLYGLPSNQTRAKVEAGTVSGVKITVQNGTVYSVGDNLARGGITIQYVGADAAATAGTTANSVVLAAGSDAADSATINFSDFPTVQQLVDRINTVPGWSATAAAASSLNPSGTLDIIAPADAKTAPLALTANLQAAIDWLNSGQNSFVTAQRAPGAGVALALVGFTYLAGGSYPATTAEDWTNAIDVLQTVDVQHITPLSADPDVWAAMDAHVQYMSTVGRRERRAVVGGAVGLTIAGVAALGVTINSDRTAFAWPAHYDVDALGNKTFQPGYMTAAMVAAGHAASAPGASLTNKAISVAGLQFLAANPSDTDTLINAGILCIDLEPTGFMVVRDISTWLQNNNYNRVENSCAAAVDYVTATVRSALDVLRGGPVSPRSLAQALNIANTTLTNLAKAAPVGPGVIVGDANSPAFSNLQATAQGDVIGVSFQCSPVIPDNFITVGISVVPYAGTATLAAAT